MCRNAPYRRTGWLALVPLVLLAAVGVARGQESASYPGSVRPDWRRIGNSAFEAFLASAATGQVDRVWFSADGSSLFLRTQSGRYFESQDFENWKARAELTPPVDGFSLDQAVARPPEPGAKVRAGDDFYARLYAFGRDIYRSEDGGRRWENLTRFRGRSIVGEGFLDFAVSPVDSDVLVAANSYGIWRTVDGGLSWSGLNDGLPNLPIRKIVAAPSGTRGTTVLLDSGTSLEWAPGERQSWKPSADSALARQQAVRRSAGLQVGAEITAVALTSEFMYAGSSDGRLWVSRDQGETWLLSRPGGSAPVESLYAVAGEPRMVLAGLGESASGGPRVLRSQDGGAAWEDLTGDLPAGGVRGVTADRTGAAVYAATVRGLFFSRVDALQTRQWIPLSESLPPAPVMDVRLDEAGHQLYVALDGLGVYAAPAPHRFWSLDVVSSADLSRRPAAPGSLLTVLGGRLLRAQAGLLEVPVLAAADGESQIQVPFEATGSSVPLAFELARGRISMSLPLQDVSPAIFVDRDGSALLLDAASGALLDGLTPARAGTRVQILATGLGKVLPPWPTGRAAPLGEPHSVVARVRALLDRTPVEVTRATLAPGYIGFYLVEVQLPPLVNAGPAELYLEADGQESNRVRIDLEP